MSGTAFEPAPVAVNLPANSRIDARNATGAQEREAYRPSIPDYLYRARGASVSQRHSGELNEACEYDQQTKHGDLPALHLLSPPSTSAGDGSDNLARCAPRSNRLEQFVTIVGGTDITWSYDQPRTARLIPQRRDKASFAATHRCLLMALSRHAARSWRRPLLTQS